MTITDTIRMALTKTGYKVKYLNDNWYDNDEKTNVVYNKCMRDSWFARDLLKVCRLIGCKLAFEFPDGQRIYFDPDAEEKD